MDPLEKIVADAEANASLNDAETKQLVADLSKMLENAKSGVYHCFHKNGAEMPKMKLHNDLMEVDTKMMKGMYDNRS